MQMITETEMHESLKGRVFSFETVPGLIRQAAVLIPIYLQDDEWQVVFIRRTDTVQDHKGEVAFPGGMVEPSDVDLKDTALREANEEINLIPEEVRILGSLDPIRTVSNFLVTPFIGVIHWSDGIVPSPDEVSEVFSIPLEWLANPENHESRPYQRRNGEVEPVIFFKHFKGELLWGISALITLNFLKAIGLDK
jgi:8-oxo-dGTP pyrophosphatase MutT (NUDIX family)